MENRTRDGSCHHSVIEALLLCQRVHPLGINTNFGGLIVMEQKHFLACKETPVITDSIRYIGVNDKTIDLFESQYKVPNGVSYNSYVILDEKIAVMDTVDPRASQTWLANLQQALAGRTPDYLVVSHLEPDHAGTIGQLVSIYPNITLIGNAKTFAMLPDFFDLGGVAKLTVKEGDTVSLGSHTLQFFMAPMVHWPEVMVTYEQSSKILFSADGFGKFGALDAEEDWVDEARRYFINIVGKYGGPVQTLLKKASTLDIQMICPLHGPILKEDLGYYIGKYLTWSSYQPEEHGVLVAYASIHGNTGKAAKAFAAMLQAQGETQVKVVDLSRDDMAEAVSCAFRYDRMVLAAATYDAGLFPPMEQFLLKLKAKTYQNRTVALIENGAWAPCAAKKMAEYLTGMKNVTVLPETVTMKGALKAATEAKLQELAQQVYSL
jgi:flavorubredoxin